MTEKEGTAHTAVQGFPPRYLLPTEKPGGNEDPFQQQEDSQNAICESFEFIHSMKILSNAFYVLQAGRGQGACQTVLALLELTF